MSTWLTLTNEIKRHCSSRMLTPAQSLAHDQLCYSLSQPEWVNLCGPHGSGKTFVAWTVVQATGACYLPIPTKIDEVKKTEQIIIIDNAPRNEDDVRRLLSKCELLHTRSVLLVTQFPLVMPISQVSLPLPSPSDIGQVVHFIQRYGYFLDSEKLPENPNYWDIISACS